MQLLRYWTDYYVTYAEWQLVISKKKSFSLKTNLQLTKLTRDKNVVSTFILLCEKNTILE